ncbi:MAG: response regulator, partial [Ignavibacteriaceae bacterium]|nr:response regulator [Ignavibacteriaceae bacterium]
DIHGCEVIKLLQTDPKTAELPVIIISADAMTNQIKQLKEAGAKDFLIKPIDIVQFLKTVDEWIGISSS